MSKFAPFYGSDDFKLSVYPTIEVLKKLLDQSVPNKIDPKRDGQNLGRYKLITDLLARIDTLTVEDAYEASKELLNKDPVQRIAVSKLLRGCQDNHELKRYVKTIFKPFPGPVDRTSNQVFNTFRPFFLLQYKASQHTDIKKILLFTYFVDVC